MRTAFAKSVMNGSLVTQLRAGFAAALLLVFGVSGAAWWIALDYRDEIDVAYRTYVRTTVQLAEAQLALWQLRFGLRQYAFAGPEGREEILGEQDNLYATVEERLAAYDKTASSADERRALTNLRSLYSRYRQARPKYFELWDAGRRDEAIAWVALTVTPFGAEAAKAFDAQITLQETLAGRKQAESTQRVQTALELVAVITVALLAMLVVGYLSCVRMLRPIRQLRAQAERVVREQLGETIDASASGNEVTALVQDFQLMSDRLLVRNEALRASDERHRQLFESSRDALMTLAPPSWRFTRANQAALDLFGVASAAAFTELGPWNVSPQLQPEGRPSEIMAHEAIAAAMRDGRKRFEWEHQRLDGSRFTADLLLTRMEVGGDVFLHATVRDITETKRAREGLRQKEQLLSESQRLGRVGSWLFDMKGPISWSDEMYRLYGVSRDTFTPTPESLLGLIHPDDRPAMQAWIAACAAGEKPGELEYRVNMPDGATRVLNGRGEAVRDAGNKFVHMAGTAQDITERKRADDALRDVADRLRESSNALDERNRELAARNREITALRGLTNSLQLCMSVAEATEVIKRFCTQSFPAGGGAVYVFKSSRNYLDAITGWGPQSHVVNFPPDDCWALRRGQVHRVDGEAAGLPCPHVRVGRGEPANCCCIPMTAHGNTVGLVHIEFGDDATRSDDDQFRFAQAFADEIALALANLALRDVLRDQAIRDPLTGLYNRRYLEETMEREFARARRNSRPVAVFMLDVDHFKRFNDQFGHEAGDLVLRALGKTLKDSCRASDVPCRFGGEEFTVVLADITKQAALQWGERLLDKIRKLEVKAGDSGVGRITISSGLALFPDDGADVETLLQAADVALYQAKHSGRDRLIAYQDVAARPGPADENADPSKLEVLP
jgi:diguanylate cyclase (GGDEF)-like protein/PAS domain S-box-containing protein